MLSGLVLVFAFVLGLILLLPDRSISRFMESCGSFIAQVFGL
jgi:hypothetical protein